MSTNPPKSIDAQKMFQAFTSYAGRVAATDDAKKHQEAAKQLLKELQGCKIDNKKGAA